jgi:hypothetical protein
MKTNYLRIIAIVTLAINGLIISAQSSGIYKTFADYKNGVMEVTINCDNKNGKIKANNYFGKDYITVIKKGEKHNLEKEKIFGYELCNGELYRFMDNKSISVDDKGVLWIYSKEEIVSHSPKRGTKKELVYYFSKDGDGEIKNLTLNNLKAAFPDNNKLHDAFDLRFRSDAALKGYDGYNKMYKINHFLQTQGI